MSNSIEKFSEELKNYRLSKNFTQSKMAELIGKSVSFYSALEVGRKPASRLIVDQIVNIFQLDENEAVKLRASAAEVPHQIRMDARNMNADQKNIAMQFARRFESMDEADLEQLRKLLREDSTHS